MQDPTEAPNRALLDGPAHGEAGPEDMAHFEADTEGCEDLGRKLVVYASTDCSTEPRCKTDPCASSDDHRIHVE